MAVKNSVVSPRRNVPMILLIISAAIIIRGVLFFNFPVFITNDSGDYVSASISIYNELDFFNTGLRDARLPGYPIFLALIYPISDMNSDTILVAQIIIGVVSVILALAAGFLLQSKLLAYGLALFLTINPFHLLTEHMLLPEVLYLPALSGLIIVSVFAMRGHLTWITGICFGTLFAISNLLRANGLIFCLVLLVGIVLHNLLIYQGTSYPNKAQNHAIPYRELAIFLFTSALAVSIFVGPWLARNYSLFQKITLVNYVNRNLLIYKTFHGTIDPNLQLTNQVTESLAESEFYTGDNPTHLSIIDYQWFTILAKSYPSNQAEQIAADILSEQINHNPIQHRKDILESIKCFGGICQKLSGGRADVRFWFTFIVPDPALLHKNNTQDWITQVIPTFQYIPHGSNPNLLHLWSRTGLVFITKLRPLIYLLFIACFFIYITAKLKGYFRLHHDKSFIIPRLTLQEAAIIVLGSGYLATVIFHSTTLAAADRYAAPFDIISVSVILLIIQLRWDKTTVIQHRIQNKKSL